MLPDFIELSSLSETPWLIFKFTTVGITFFFLLLLLPRATRQYLKMAKRIASSSIRWSYIAENMLPEDQQRIAALKSVSDRYSRLIADKPTEMPKIDWSFYKSRISVPGMVDSFQKSYEALKIPYPSDQGVLAATEQSNTEMIKYAEQKLKELIEKVESLKKELKEKEAVMKYSEMTMEEIFLARPDLRNDPNNPKFWPHLVFEAEERAQKKGQ